MEQYLLSKDIYWPVGVSTSAGETPYPKLTLGTLLLVQQRLEALTVSTAQQHQPRPMGSGYDIGADEVAPASVSVQALVFSPVSVVAP